MAAPAGHAVPARDVTGLMTPRTLANSQPCLLALLQPGLDVLDVGCGSGTLTYEIARWVLPGLVVGLDLNAGLLRVARRSAPGGGLPNVRFLEGDIREAAFAHEFDLVSATRVFQWIPDAVRAVAPMVAALRPGGRLLALDSDHPRTSWADAPASWTRFHRAFLEWRAASGLDNAVVERLPGAFAAGGLVDVDRVPHVSTVRADEPSFVRVVRAWRIMADTRGRQMVAAGHLTEAERQHATADYTAWMQEPHATVTIHEACVSGRRPGATRS